MVIDQALITKALKFAVVGFTAFVVDFAMVYLFKEKVKLNKYIANTLAFMISASLNFELNRAWSFENHDPDVLTQAIKFGGSMTIGFLISMGVIYIFSDRLRMNFYFSKLLGISVAMIWNFTMANLVIFHH